MKKDLLNTLKILAAAIILSFGISAVYAQWVPPTQAPPGGNVDAPINTGETAQIKNGGLSVGAFLANSAVFNGNVNVTGDVTANNRMCIGSSCISSWPSAAGPETDPTVLASVKDGVSWNEITGKPAGFADNVDDIGTLNVITVSVTGRGVPTANCPGGYTATGGGASQSRANYPVGNGWAANAGSGNADTTTVYVRCIRMQ